MKKLISSLFLIAVSAFSFNILAKGESANPNSVGKSEDSNNFRASADEMETLLSWLERFRIASINEDADFLSNIYSKNVLILTEENMIVSPEEAVLIMDTGDGSEDLPKVLKKYMESNDTAKRINFKDIRINGNPNNINDKGSNIYTTSVEEELFFNGYTDTFNLFLIWDFQDADHPKIIGKGVSYNHDFTIDDFMK